MTNSNQIQLLLQWNNGDLNRSVSIVGGNETSNMEYENSQIISVCESKLQEEIEYQNPNMTVEMLY